MAPVQEYVCFSIIHIAYSECCNWMEIPLLPWRSWLYRAATGYIKISSVLILWTDILKYLLLIVFHQHRLKNKEQGWWVGGPIHVGNVLMYKILTKCNKVIFCSAICLEMDPAKRNNSATGISNIYRQRDQRWSTWSTQEDPLSHPLRR